MKNNIFALGFFDGVHLGHQALLKQCVALARENHAQSAAITFDRHPQSLFSDPPGLLNTVADRQRLLKQFGIEYIQEFPVTKEVMSTDWQDFLTILLEAGAAGFVCGSDFRFGYKGEGNAENLQAFCNQRGLPCIVVPEQILDGIRVSSSHIRSLLEQGKVEAANRFLGHPHIFTGTVVPGRQLGRTIGIPTANLHLPEDVLIPKFGVYACIACFDGKKFPAVTNIGTRPTVNGHHITIEPWILDFSGDLYGQEITLEFHHFLRPEQKFASLEELQQEILNNAQQTRNLLDFCKKVGK
jgi:riboflavin kinase/FMN adenylyltransferase